MCAHVSHDTNSPESTPANEQTTRYKQNVANSNVNKRALIQTPNNLLSTSGS